MEEKIKILLAEDDTNLGMLLKEYLRAKGFDAVLCEDGEIAYDAFLNQPFDICIFDVMMPKKDGFTLAKEVRQINSEIPIIFLTAKNMKEDVLEGFKIGADDYMSKPFSMEELLLRIEAVLRRSTGLKPEDEQEIFDTINSLGVNLTTSELLKNYFFNRETVGEYERKWADVFEKDDETKVYWDREIETGRIKRAIIDIFFDSYFQLFIQDKQYNISNEDKLMYSRVDRLAQSYQHFINKYCGGNKNIVLDQMKEYAECFRNNLKPNQCGMSIPKEEGIERINVVIFGLKNTTMIPYILYIAKNVQDKNELIKMYGILESYIMRRVVVHASTKSYNNLFTSLILNKVLDSQTLTLRLKGIGDATTYCPDDNEMKIGFETSKLVNLQSKGIIYLLESKIRSDNSSTALLGFNNYSLEHLMPKKWRNNWGACATEDDAKKRDSLLLTLGNLAIIPQALNASIRDAAWNVKKAGKGQNKPGLLLCASGLYTLHDVLQKNDWNEHEIENRAEWLLANAQNIWKI